jgi:hypothetical protein
MSRAERAGSDAGGLRLTATLAELRLEAWGYWSPEVVAAFRRQSISAARKLGDEPGFVLDGKGLKPQGADGQDALREFSRTLAALPVVRCSVNASNALAGMQLTRPGARSWTGRVHELRPIVERTGAPPRGKAKEPEER